MYSFDAHHSPDVNRWDEEGHANQHEIILNSCYDLLVSDVKNPKGYGIDCRTKTYMSYWKNINVIENAPYDKP